MTGVVLAGGVFDGGVVGVEGAGVAVVCAKTGMTRPTEAANNNDFARAALSFISKEIRQIRGAASGIP